MKSILRIPIAGFVLMVIIHSAIMAQTKKSWPEGIPSSFRESLVTRLTQYMELEQAGRFDSQYDLFDKATMLKTKDEYVAVRRETERLVEFEPTSISCSKNPTTCRIEGRAKWQWENAMPLLCGASSNARLQNGEWYFSEWSGTDDCYVGMEKLTTTAPETKGTLDPKTKQKPRTKP